MIVSVDLASPTPAYEQIRGQITSLVNSGAIEVGTRLPPIRQLAQDLELAPGTVAKAYALLERTGVATTHRRRGTIVRDRAALDEDERRRELAKAAASFAQTIRLLNVDADTARAAVDAALSTWLEELRPTAR
jgi:DNA-binding transcriptional regulator YhcF (GntR family)